MGTIFSNDFLLTVFAVWKSKCKNNGAVNQQNLACVVACCTAGKKQMLSMHSCYRTMSELFSGLKIEG